MIKKLSYIFGSKTKAQEIVFLQHDLKKVVRQGFYEEELRKVEKFCLENNLFLARSKFKVLLADETAYSNKGIRVKTEDPRKGMYLVYISKDEQKSWRASYYELVGNEKELGRELGYPKCCVDFFCSRFTPDNPNLQLKPGNPYTNLSQREKDCVLISHFPCSSECAESMEIAKKNFALLHKLDLERAREMWNTLSSSSDK